MDGVALSTALRRRPVRSDLEEVFTTLGVNWWVNRWVKIQANFIREKLDDPSLGPLPSIMRALPPQTSEICWMSW